MVSKKIDPGMQKVAKMDISLHRKAKKIAVNKGITLYNLVNEAVEDYIKKQ